MAVVRILLMLLCAFVGAFVAVRDVRLAVLGAQTARELDSGALNLFLGGDPLMTYGVAGVFFVAAMLIGLLWHPAAARRKPRSTPPVDVKPGQKPTKKAARALVEARRYKEAADMFRALGDVDALIDALVKSGDVMQAAELLESETKHREAAEMLEEANQPAAMQRAGELWKALGNADRAQAVARKAASLYSQRGEGDRAVELLLKAGDVDTARSFATPAAEAYARQGRHARAGEMFESLGMDQQAGAAFEYEAGTQKDEQSRRQCGVRAAKLYRNVNDWRSCGRVLEAVGYPDKALEAYGRAEAWHDAARCLTAMGQGQRAAELLIAKGMGHEAVTWFESQGDMVGAAHAAFAAGDYVHAAQLFDETGNMDMAFQAHMKMGNFTAAAEIAMQKNRPAEAAELFERGSNFKRAAEIHEGLNNRLKAGELYGKSGDVAGAARMLLADGKVREAASVVQGSPKPEVADVQSEVARKLMMSGDLRAAVQFLKACVDARTPGDSVTLSLELSNLMEAAGDVPAALAYAQRVLQAKKDHAEAVLRVQQLFMRINSDQMRAAYESAMQQQVAAQSALSAQKKMVETAPQPAKDEAPRYVVESELGRGAMGVVCKARDTVLNRYVALKRLPEAVASDAEARARFLAEARAAAGLNHPAIVTVYDAGVERGLPYLAMELVEGTTLGHVLHDQGPLPPSKALAYCAAISSALDHAHRAGIVHRDVKPGNILMGRDGRVKLTDFGIAAAVLNTSADGVTGTPYYMAPEQIAQAPIDGRTDLYALGCVLFALLTGSPPFSGSDVLQKHLHESPPRASLLRAGLPPEIDAVLERCLAKEPSARFPTGEAAARAFLDVEARMRLAIPAPI